MIDIRLTNDPTTVIDTIAYSGATSGTLVYADLTDVEKIKVTNFINMVNSHIVENTCKLSINSDDYILDLIYTSGASCDDDYMNLCDAECMTIPDKAALMLFLPLLA